MSDLTPEIIDEVVAACEANGAEAAEALSRALGCEVTLGETIETGSFDPADPPEAFHASGLALLLGFGEVGMIALLPEPGGLVPQWVRQPDETGVSTLATLAQELGMLLVPETLMVEEFSATWLPSLADGLARAGIAAGSAMVTLSVASQDASSPLYLVWPATALRDVAEAESDFAEPKPEEPNRAESKREEPKPSGQSTGGVPERPRADFEATGRRHQYGDLPPYARHLLKIEVPVMVNLVSKKQTIQEIMELGPGAIVNFEKSCDDPLELMVGNRRVALGSAVKVGDKFGIEITEVCLPDESFVPVAAPRASA